LYNFVSFENHVDADPVIVVPGWHTTSVTTGTIATAPFSVSVPTDGRDTNVVWVNNGGQLSLSTTGVRESNNERISIDLTGVIMSGDIVTITGRADVVAITGPDSTNRQIRILGNAGNLGDGAAVHGIPNDEYGIQTFSVTATVDSATTSVLIGSDQWGSVPAPAGINVLMIDSIKIFRPEPADTPLVIAVDDTFPMVLGWGAGAPVVSNYAGGGLQIEFDDGGFVSFEFDHIPGWYDFTNFTVVIGSAVSHDSLTMNLDVRQGAPDGAPGPGLSMWPNIAAGGAVITVPTASITHAIPGIGLQHNTGGGNSQEWTMVVTHIVFHDGAFGAYMLS
jgi:hypothetical protein